MVKTLSGLLLWPLKEGSVCVGKWHCWGREGPSWPCYFLRGRRNKKTDTPGPPQLLHLTHLLPIAKPVQPGLGLFSSYSEKTHICLCCWEALRWLWISSFCLSSCRLQELMSRQWHGGRQTALGDELRDCFGLPYSKCTNWVKDCSGRLFNQRWGFWVALGYFGCFTLMFGVCFVQVEHDMF